MHIRLSGQTGGGIQFVVHADSDADQVALQAFQEQVRANQFWLHGFASAGDGRGLGPASFNFGTIKPPAPAKETADG
jgi:hypothetical protein